MLTFKEVYSQIQDRLKDNHRWTKKELDLIFKSAEEEWELALYREILIENAAKMVVRLMKKKAKVSKH